MKRVLLTLAAVFVAVSAYAKLPIIGVSGSMADDRNVVNAAYTEAVIAAGGVPVMIPVMKDDALIEAVVSTIDGLIMTGGEDFDPLKHYEEEPVRALGTIAPERDEFDVKLVREAVRRGIPVLGICRGEQLLAVAFGGSLWQDIPSQVEGSSVKHRQSPTPASYGTHSILIEKGSFLEKALETDKTVVNSFHHQAIKALAPGFKAVAASADGIIEAVERIAPITGFPDGGGMVIGVQFHPEGLVRGEDKSFLAIFKLLVDEAAK